MGLYKTGSPRRIPHSPGYGQAAQGKTHGAQIDARNPSLARPGRIDKLAGLAAASTAGGATSRRTQKEKP
ncbi:hypothetical protein AB4Z48_28055 [Cupriavidus sp. 2TAF22]|uniref:hypothetical protein n=1 Tax=unclassified Cupriavidus TaxID=2640874 RepID=UPI003F93624A